MGKWFHDPEFDLLHPIQWKLYAHLITQDDKEEIDNDIAKIEYAMSFYDSDAVRKARQQRELEKNKPTDEQFSNQLQRLFGRGLPEQKKKKTEDDLDQIKVVK